LPLSHATIWRLVGAGEFPKPFKIGASTMWDLAEVEAFIATKRLNNSDFKIG
jgi:predicted DNA-binding transcriptional regulator AlpA